MIKILLSLGIFFLVACLIFFKTHSQKEKEVSMDVHTLDKELRDLEKSQVGTILPLMQDKAKELGYEFFEHFVVSKPLSQEQAWEYRALYVPILYKLGRMQEAADLAQVTFEFLFPQLHKAVETRLQALFGSDFAKKCNEIICGYQLKSDQIDQIAYRIKSTHSIWKKVESLEALEKMTPNEFAATVNDFIGIRWEMKVFDDENRYDALIKGVVLAPPKNRVTFRNQQLPQENGFASEPVMKICYVIDGFPLELQLLGGNMTAYMSAKGYAAYKTKLALTPKKDEMYEKHRLGMAVKWGNREPFRKYMWDELVGIVPDYSNFEPFVLDTLPNLKTNRDFRFSENSKPVCEMPNLNFNTQ